MEYLNILVLSPWVPLIIVKLIMSVLSSQSLIINYPNNGISPCSIRHASQSENYEIPFHPPILTT